MAIATTPFDAAEYLDTPEAVAAYLTEALDSGDSGLVRDALGVVARAKGMSQVAKEAELNRESLYRSFSEGGNPEFATVMRVFGALGLKLTVRPARSRRSAAKPKARARKAA